jgi:type II secretory ATPase GspE/PulE/Tfp pilus assembly ATPase PilB-like protein
VLKHATIHARLIAYGGHSGGLAAEKSDCLADLMDAVHNLPDLLQHWEKCDERLLRLFLQDFDEKWNGQTGIRLLAMYLRLVERGPDQQGNASSSDTDRIGAALHRDLLSGLKSPRGLILVASPTGQGKTTAIERVLLDSACPPNVVFMGDLRGDLDAARRAVSTARSSVVVAVLRIPRAASAFRRLIDMSVPATELSEVSQLAFSTRLFRPSEGDTRQEFRLLHERIVVTDAIRSLIIAGAGEDAIHRCAIAEGMSSLRQVGLEQVRAGHLTPAAVATMTPDD